jgi:hypothetical protein
MAFTGKSIPKGVSLPEDMWIYLEERRARIGISVSRQIQDAIEHEIHLRERYVVESPTVYRSEEV